MADQTKWREPSQFIAGDTLSFTRKLAQYPASAGWSLLYALRGGAQAIEFTSTADGDNHQIDVLPAVTETWLPGEYVMEGFAVNVSGERHQIYLNSLPIYEDLSQAPGDAVVTTHAQRMLTNIEASLEKMALNPIVESDVEGTRLRREARMELFKLRAKYFHERKGELATEAAKARKPTGRKILTVLNITPGGNTHRGTYGAGNSVFNVLNP